MLAKCLSREHEVRVITNRYPRSLSASETIDGIRVDRVLLVRPRFNHLRRKRADLFLGSLYYGPDSYRRLKTIFKEFRPEVVNAHFPDHQIPFLLKLRQKFDFRLVVSLHGNEVERLMPSNESNGCSHLKESAEPLRAILKQADTVTAVSQYLLDRACEVEPAISDKSHVIHNAVDPKRFQESKPYAHQRPYMLGVGRLTRAKGFDLLIDAFAKTGAKDDIDLIIAGDGDQRDSLQNQAGRLGLSETVHFPGATSDAQVAALLNGCLCVAVPSRSESFGMVALEALAAGKPLLATRVGGLKELLREAEVVVCEAEASRLAEGIKATIGNASKDRATVRNREYAARFSSQRMVEEYLRAYFLPALHAKSSFQPPSDETLMQPALNLDLT
jgi:glycosyltransferase involved in cell wall biosynthesis